jgi:Cys-rich protein (TIGR01571 family)
MEVFCFVEEKEEKEDAFKEVSKKRGEIEGRGGTPSSSSSSSSSIEEAQEQECVELFPMAMDLRMPSSSGSRGLQRLWEGGLFEIGDHSDVTIQTAFCPCATFGRNMERSGFGTSWGQGGIFLLLSVGAVSFYITYVCTGSPWFIYGTLSLLLLMAMYAGHYRVRMRRRFNIIVSFIFITTLLCSCSTLTLLSFNRPVTWFIGIPLSCTTFIPSMEICFQINLFSACGAM